MNDKDRAQLKILNAHRNSIKGQLRSLEGFLKNYKKETDLSELKLRTQTIENLFENFDYIHNKMDSLDESEESTNQRFAIFDQYYKIISNAQQKLGENNSLESSSSFTHETPILEDDRRSNSLSSNTRKRKLKLPEIKLPSFDGDAEKWLSFKNAFIELVQNEPELNNYERFHHLRSALSGNALNKIEIFTISEENYNTAWNTLIEAYENRRNLLAHHLSSLLHLPQQEKQGHKSLAALSNGALQHTKSLAALGVKMPDKIIVQMIEEKLAPRTYHKWEDSLTNFDDNEFPSLKQMIKFLDKQINNASRREKHVTTESKSDRNSRPPPNKIRGVQSSRTLVSTVKKCLLCPDDPHPLYRCTKFRNMSVASRNAHVKETTLCPKCLRKHSYSMDECKFGVCPIFRRPHNSLLHYPKSNPQDDSTGPKQNTKESSSHKKKD